MNEQANGSGYPGTPKPSTGARIRRILLSLAFALLMTATAYLCAWFNLRATGSFSYPYHYAQMDFKHLSAEIEDFSQENGRLPESLSEIPNVSEVVFQRESKGNQPLDRWGNPYVYQVAGNEYELLSHGRDGKPGGVGLDADLHPGETNTWSATFQQFTFEMPTGGIKLSCVLAGLAAGAMCFNMLPGNRRNQITWSKTVIGLILTTAATIYFALFLAAAHIPNGH